VLSNGSHRKGRKKRAITASAAVLRKGLSGRDGGKKAPALKTPEREKWKGGEEGGESPKLRSARRTGEGRFLRFTGPKFTKEGKQWSKRGETSK